MFVVNVILEAMRQPWEPENENIPGVPSACAAYLNTTQDPSLGQGVSKHQEQGYCELPERERGNGSDLPECMDWGEPFVVLKGQLPALIQTQT
jgi:hypothetical protein